MGALELYRAARSSNSWRRTTRQAIPYGVYDVADNSGFVNVGTVTPKQMRELEIEPHGSGGAPLVTVLQCSRISEPSL